MEIVIETADTSEVPFGAEADDSVGIVFDARECFHRRDGDGDNHLGCSLALDGDEGCLHGRTGRKAVVDDDSNSPTRVHLGTVSEICRAAAL